MNSDAQRPTCSGGSVLKSRFRRFRRIHKPLLTFTPLVLVLASVSIISIARGQESDLQCSSPNHEFKFEICVPRNEVPYSKATIELRFPADAPALQSILLKELKEGGKIG